MPLEENLREFLLGISDQEAERNVEEGVLSGDVDSRHLELAEDELIDDYLFGKLSQEEDRGFTSHFLCTEDRRQRLALARAIIQYANKRSVNFAAVHREPLQRKTRVSLFAWKAFAASAFAASIVLAILLELRSADFQKETQVARNAQNENERLRAALAAQKIRSQESAPPLTSTTMSSSKPPISPLDTNIVSTLELLPLSRGLPPTLRFRIATTQFVRINLVLATPLSEKFNEDLTGAGHKQLWTKMIEASPAQPVNRSTIIVPASLLPDGKYEIHLRDTKALPDDPDLAAFAFHVATN